MSHRNQSRLFLFLVGNERGFWKSEIAADKRNNTLFRFSLFSCFRGLWIELFVNLIKNFDMTLFHLMQSQGRKDINICPATSHWCCSVLSVHTTQKKKQQKHIVTVPLTLPPFSSGVTNSDPYFLICISSQLNLMGCLTASRPLVVTLRNSRVHLIDSLMTRNIILPWHWLQN